MKSAFKYAEDGEEEEVRGILQASKAPQEGIQYNELVSRFGSLMMGTGVEKGAATSFNSFAQNDGAADQYLQSLNPHGLDASWNENAREIPTTGAQRTSLPQDPFNYGLSGLSMAHGNERDLNDTSPKVAWYENLPESGGQEKLGVSNKYEGSSSEVPFDLKFLSSTGEQPMFNVMENSLGESTSPGQSGGYDTNVVQMPQMYSQQYYPSTMTEPFQPQLPRQQQYYPPSYPPPQSSYFEPTYIQPNGVPSQDRNTSYNSPKQRPPVHNNTYQQHLPKSRPVQQHVAHHQSSTDHGRVNGNKDVDARRAELVESPVTRLKFKEFYRQFRAREKESYEQAYAYAEECLRSTQLPKKIHWRIYLEMADLAKRENQFTEARELYKTVNQLQPYAPQGWLEYSKMEEECGRLFHCQKILHEGLKYCNFSESLLTKAIKHEERMGNLVAARALLGRLRGQNVDKAWRTILEGALLEARAGNVLVARKVFKYLMQNVPWYGPIYYEAARFEEKNEDFSRAIAIVERGLKEIPRYGPLWFNAFRLHETTEMNQLKQEMINNPSVPRKKCRLLAVNTTEYTQVFGVPLDVFDDVPESCEFTNTRGALQRAMNCISKELVWKVHFEAAQVAERGRCKNWLEQARQAYVQSVLRCPINLRWKIWLAGARTELTDGHIQKARQLLQQALKDVPEKSKAQVLLECSRLEEYTENVDEARNILSRARRETQHEWKVFLESVMLEVRSGNRAVALKEAESALEIHSGTGRLWAILVQLKHADGPDLQRVAFREALKMVPKSGEVWCEGARVHMHPLSPYFDLNTAQRYLEFAIQFTPQYGDSFIEALRWELLKCKGDTEAEHRKAMEEYDTSMIIQRCVNADPNYGGLWFHCKRGPFDTARQVLRTAKKILIAELSKFRNVYKLALEASEQKKVNETLQGGKTPERTTPVLVSGENKWITDRLLSCGWSEETASMIDFSTGLTSVNWLRERVFSLDLSERRKLLFGSDTIVP